jgi:inner membrane protein COX18
MPIINSLKPGVSKLVLAEMQKIGVRGTKDQIQAAHAKRVKQLVSLRVVLLL